MHLQAAELSTLSEILSGVIRKAVSKAKDEIREEFRREMDARIAALPIPEKGKDAKPLNIDEIVSQVLVKIPTPKDGRDGIDGKSVDVDVLRAEVLALLPAPKDGKDGKDADPEHVRSLIAEAVAEIPKPKDGKDAEPVDVDSVVQKVLAQIPSPKDGRDGMNGKDGKDAEPVNTAEIIDSVLKAIPTPKDGERGERGEKGIDGKDGRDGREGKDGRDGERGRDALSIEILSAIDPSKEYPRGTFAKDKNGLWRREATGWECIVSGIQGFDITQSEDLRSFVFTVRSSDGSTIEKQFSIPVMIYRYLHDKEQSYKVGDTVTYDGNIWHSNVDDPTTLPGTSKEWTLAVRAGRPGRDLRPEEPKQHTPVQLGNGKKK